MLVSSTLVLFKTFQTFLCTGSSVQVEGQPPCAYRLRMRLFSLNCDPMGARTGKRYFSLKSVLNLFRRFLNFLLSGLHKKYCYGFFNILSLRFLTIYISFFLTVPSKGMVLNFGNFDFKFLVNLFSKISNSPLYLIGKLKGKR